MKVALGELLILWETVGHEHWLLLQTAAGQVALSFEWLCCLHQLAK